MPKKKTPTAEKIILTTIDLIEEKGIQKVTTRNIAQRAKVNLASINYYFGSKEQLIKLALKRTLDEMNQMPAETLGREDLNPKEKLNAFLEAFMAGAIKWPGITKGHLYEPFINNNYNTIFVRRFNNLINEVMEKIKDLKLKPPHSDLKLSIIQLISAVTIPGILPKLFKHFSSCDFTQKEKRKAYIDDLINHYFE